MSLTKTPICNFGEEAKDFKLISTENKKVSLADIKGKNGILIMFICNHCPYVKAVINDIVEDAKYLESLEIKSAAIMSNDVKNYPEDSFDNMTAFARKSGFTFPYVIDETQDVARTYDAVCTPDFFGFNGDLKLQYRGRLDESRNQPATPSAPRELLEAMRQVAETGHGPEEQIASMGCSIKWRPEST